MIRYFLTRCLEDHVHGCLRLLQQVPQGWTALPRLSHHSLVPWRVSTSSCWTRNEPGPNWLVIESVVKRFKQPQFSWTNHWKTSEVAQSCRGQSNQLWTVLNGFQLETLPVRSSAWIIPSSCQFWVLAFAAAWLLVGHSLAQERSASRKGSGRSVPVRPRKKVSTSPWSRPCQILASHATFAGKLDWHPVCFQPPHTHDLWPEKHKMGCNHSELKFQKHPTLKQNPNTTK